MTYSRLDPRAIIDSFGSDYPHTFTRQIRAEPVEYGSEMQPYLACSGPVNFSTDTRLTLLSDWPIFDVNGYYTSLGFSWPYRPVSKVALREHYQALDGHTDDWLTYCLHRLLDPEVRVVYDRRALGMPMPDDRRVQELMERIAVQRISRERLKRSPEYTEDDFIQEMGLPNGSDPAGDDLASAATDPEPVDQGQDQLMWPFGYYLLHSRRFDPDGLSEWQCMLIESCREEGLSVQLALGYLGGTDHPWRFAHAPTHPTTTIVLINDTATPHREITQAIASNLASHSTSIEENRMAEEITNPFATGGIEETASARAEREARRNSRGGVEFLTQLFTDKNDSVIVRFIIDEPQWVRVKQHDFVPTKPAPKDKPADAKWPEKMGAVCRRSPGPDGVTPIHDDCYLCEQKDSKGKMAYFPKRKMWALAVVRKEVFGTQEMIDKGQIPDYKLDMPVGAVDDIIEVDEIRDGQPTGRKVQKKHYVVINMGNKNFFDNLIPFAKQHKTMLDRDYKITKEGTGLETEYKAVPLDVIMYQDANGKQEPFTLQNPKFAAMYLDDERYSYQALLKMIMNRMSEEYYGRFFDTRVSTSWKREDDDVDDAATPAASAPPVDTPTTEKLMNFRDRLTKNNPTPAANAAEDVAQDSEPVADFQPMANFSSN